MIQFVGALAIVFIAGLLILFFIIRIFKRDFSKGVKTASIVAGILVVVFMVGAEIGLSAKVSNAEPSKSIPAKETKQEKSTISPELLASYGDMPGVMDARTDALTKKEIEQQKKTAKDMMNEKAMAPKLLKDGTKQYTLTANPIIWNLYEQKNVNASGYNGQTSGPLIQVKVGDKVRIVLKNKLNEPTSLRFQGLSVPKQMGGLPDQSVKPGDSKVYEFTVTQDMVGTHDYFSGTDMDEQIDYGLHGALIVDPAKGKEYPDADVEALFDIGSFKVDQKFDENVFTLNGKPSPNSPNFYIKKGQRVVVRLINSSSENYHAMHLHGYTFKLISEDGHHLKKPMPMNVVSLAPEETADIEFIANAPGTWMFHCHILDHTINPDDDVDAMQGLMTNFIVK
ncbi:multicopper oxidase domain-containing protein [Pullulanibacillus sp. KACC 23026]|uniref:multicopper oxidase family protein n=1 Tax=Pullulanibacillus sp. KACC 23026 TaxID=3028315 RepID=UPI0023B0F2F4|nr:multicopper oxidase domain-containing protein [Pullulanibacillus sp. KACC 23026]WEG12635.1 multicopper oxidase domain-containing protein [Pullulanibacillus sp. KACC 23026]